MKLDFDLTKVKHIEFGVGLDATKGQVFKLISVEKDVQSALSEMVSATRKELSRLEDDTSTYNPAEKHSAKEYLTLPLSDDLAVMLKNLHEMENIAHDSKALSNAAAMFCYFARMTDKSERKLTALRRSAQFKGVLKHRLLRFSSDALRMIKDDVFKLDTDFDVLVDDQQVHILRPSGFEYACSLQNAVLGAVPKNVASIQKRIEFVDFGPIADYAKKHPRAARYLASIRTHPGKVDKGLLLELCKVTGVELQQENGQLTVEDGHILDFLEVLDRRRYELKLVKEQPERYRAPSRRRI